MAAGDTQVSICNKALILLGAESITSFADGSLSAAACSNIYPEVKATTLALYPWSFSIAKIQLARDTATPNTEYTYQYVLPSDLLTGVPRAVFVSSSPGAAVYKKWEIGRSDLGLPVLMTEATEIYIDYQQSVSEGQMPSYFVQLLVYQLSWHLAEIITDQIGKLQLWKTEAVGTPSEGGRGGYFRQAVNIDSAGQTPQVIADYMLVEVRG
jgi:hypothetical protein